MQTFVLCTLLVAGAAAANRQKFTVQPWSNIKGTMVGVIGLGTPMQPTTMELNPTSPDFFVIESTCLPKGQCTQNRHGYDIKASSTFKEGMVPFYTKHMGGRSIGRLAKESLTALAIPGKAPPQIPLPMLKHLNGGLISGVANGLMGWGFPQFPLPVSFLQVMLKKLDLPQWEMYQQAYKYKNGVHEIYGNVTYGNKDTDHCQDDHFFVKTDKPKSWSLRMDSASLGNKYLRGGSAAVFPGSPQIHAPQDVVTNIRRELNAQYDPQLREFTVDCAKVRSMPTLRLTFSQHQFTYYPREYMVQAEGTNKCVLMINGPSQKYTGGDWILGDPLFREHCVLFDFNGPRVGFAKVK